MHTPRPARPRTATRVGTALLLALAASCGGRGVSPSVSLGPRLTSARLGSLRCAMTYDGDWLGGMPPIDALEEDFELAARRGIELVVDLRGDGYRESVPLDEVAAREGLELVTVGRGGDGARGEAPITDASIDRVRRILTAPGRRRALLLDEDGRLASVVYAIHLGADEGVAVPTALRAARATGLGDAEEDFVREQVSRIRGEP